MEKNIAALVRENTFTIGVKFNEYRESKEYTYVSIFPVKVGDHVVVDTAGELKLVPVTRVDEFLDIPPQSSTKFKYVVAKVDMDAYTQLLEQNQAIEKEMNKQYSKSMRRSYRERVLENLDGESLKRIQAALSGSTVEGVEEVKVGGTE